MKNLIIIITLIIVTSCTYNKSQNTLRETPLLSNQKDSLVKYKKSDYEFEYRMLDKDILNIDSINSFSGITENEIYEYSEEVKGKFITTLNNQSIFPHELVTILEEALYNSCNYSPRKQSMSEIMEIFYFDTIRDLGSEDYTLSLDELYILFPELYKNEFTNEYDAYKFISGSENCIDMFHADIKPNQNYYVFVYDLGGSNGHVSVKLEKLINNEFITISEFKTQNSGFGKVIKHEEIFYYIFLQYNYNLKNYDGIRIHKLGLNPDTENILIRYLPEKYIWKNVYNIKDNISSNLSIYVDSVKDYITSNEYLENGLASEIGIINSYDEIDFTNSGVPIYIMKSNHIPSNYQSTWYLKAKFYACDLESNVEELDNLELGKYNQTGVELVQMWFKEIDNKVFTFRIYHISDYNYILNVVLIESNKVTQIRNDIFSPQRRFVLIEGKSFVGF